MPDQTRWLVVGVVLGVVLLACDPAGRDDETDAGADDEVTDDVEAPADADERSDDVGVDDRDPDVAAPDSDDDADPPRPDLEVDVTLERVAEVSSAVAATVTGDGEVLLGSRDGTVHHLGDDGASEPLLDLRDETTTDGERGLLGLAVAEDGEELYVSFTDTAGDSRVDAFGLDGVIVDVEERRTVFSLEQPFSNHNGGHVVVGPDGMLYIGMGDGGGAGDPVEAGQDLSTPLGALLRIDPRGGDPYVVPEDNPFVDDRGAAGEIFAYGLRNPWRFSFDRETGELWIADVGQDTREEINRVGPDEAPGANFGWNLMEGTVTFAGDEPEDHTPPVYEYDTRGPEGCAVTGGFVYRGEAIPELVGAYLYADYCNGEVRALVVDDDGEVVEQGGLGVDGGEVVSFAEDDDGEVLVLDVSGDVRRLLPA